MSEYQMALIGFAAGTGLYLLHRLLEETRSANARLLRVIELLANR